MNSSDGQKHFASLLEVHFGTILSQVFRHLGTRFGQEAVCSPFPGPEADADADPDANPDPDPEAPALAEGDWTYVVMDGLGFDDTEIGIRDEPEGPGAGAGGVECGMTGVETEVGLKVVILPTQAGHTEEVVVRVRVDSVV